MGKRLIYVFVQAGTYRFARTEKSERALSSKVSSANNIGLFPCHNFGAISSGNKCVSASSNKSINVSPKIPNW